LFQIATSAKKLWGVEEHQKDDKNTGGNILQHLGDHHQVWRDSTWSNAGEFFNFFYIPSNSFGQIFDKQVARYLN